MKKVILIVAIVLVALVGLTSYNSNEGRKEKGNGNLIAELKTGGTGVSQGTGTIGSGSGGTGTKKID